MWSAPIQKDKVPAHGKYFNTWCLTSDVICNWRQTLKQFESPLKCFISNHIFPRKGVLVLKTSFIPAFDFENVLPHWQSGQLSFCKDFQASRIWLLFVGPCLASSLNALDIFAFAFCHCPSVFVGVFIFAFCTCLCLCLCLRLLFLSLPLSLPSVLRICLWDVNLHLASSGHAFTWRICLCLCRGFGILICLSV